MIVSNIPNSDNSFSDQDKYNSISKDEDDDIDIQEVKIVKPPVISPFDTTPVMPEESAEAHNNMIADVLSDISLMRESLKINEHNVVKPLLFGEEAQEYFD